MNSRIHRRSKNKQRSAMKAQIPWQPTNKQRSAMLDEINRQIVIGDKKHYLDTVALVLYTLHIHKSTRFGKKRLRNFFDDFDKIHQDLLDKYELNDDESPWIAHRMLQEIGVNVEEWVGNEERN